MCKGCKLYEILALHEKGEAEGIEKLPIVQEFAYIFPEELPNLRAERELDFIIDLKLGIEPIARDVY
jgi:hypothetical protein